MINSKFLIINFFNFFCFLRILTVQHPDETYTFDYQPTCCMKVAMFPLRAVQIEMNQMMEQQFQITASDGAILEFNGFDIGSFLGRESNTPDSVRFIQPSTNAKVYNKIISEEITEKSVEASKLMGMSF